MSDVPEGYTQVEIPAASVPGTVIVGGWVERAETGSVVISCPQWSHWVTDALPAGTEIVLVTRGRSPYWSLVDDDA